MANTTTNHNLNKPVDDEDDWGTDLNNNADTLDAILKNLTANGAVASADLTSTTGSNAGEVLRHDGTGTLPAGALCRWDGSNWRLLEPVSFSYTGDGTTGRTIAASFQFEQVIVEEAGGTAVDAYAGGLSNGALSGGSFSGALTVESTGGFTVGDNSADADPNTNGESYSVHAG